MNNNIIKKYYIPPPYINSNIQYQNIDIDHNLRKLITKFYLKKLIKWIKNYKEFENLKHKLSDLESNKGINIIYNLLRSYSKKKNIKWFDMKEKNNYYSIKNYFNKKLMDI